MLENITDEIRKAQVGDKDAMANLVKNNQGLIWSIVRRFANRGYEIEDINQIGTLGFIKAIRNFDLEFDVKISTYAVPYILGEIKRFLRDDGPIKISRSLKDLNRKIAELQKEYRERKGEDLTINEISKILKVPKEEIVLALESTNPINSIEENIYSNNDDKSLNILDTISTNKDEANLITNKIVINKIIEKLDSRDKQIILLRFYKDKTQADVAKILGISQVQVSRLEKKILTKMKEELA